MTNDASYASLNEIIIWNNSEFKSMAKPFLSVDNGVITIRNLLEDRNDFLMFDVFKQKFKLNTFFASYYELIHALISLKQRFAKPTNQMYNKESINGRNC